MGKKKTVKVPEQVNQTFPCSSQSPNLQERLLLLHVFVDERYELLRLSVPTSAPVLLPAVLLLQTLQHATHLGRQVDGQVNGGTDRLR